MLCSWSFFRNHSFQQIHFFITICFTISHQHRTQSTSTVGNYWCLKSCQRPGIHWPSLSFPSSLASLAKPGSLPSPADRPSPPAAHLLLDHSHPEAWQSGDYWCSSPRSLFHIKSHKDLQRHFFGQIFIAFYVKYGSGGPAAPVSQSL